ncbi:hypothetical protein BDFB_003646 [Asbolus verrucosus]|uniref:Uncharacterized protein n=1 Tax=Asbolus verrucosus TaxID=1661398 RepID=A0A482VKL6_ASBVE|nr:hypothetical protein BDFB_003646 [Asbolus verrucosus]
MKLLVLLASLCLAHCGVISQDTINHGIEHHERATSYQNIHIEHFHPVPTYIKKEDSHLLQHPISLGTSSSKVEIHHGDKHDHGYALASAENHLHGQGFEDFNEGLGSSGGGHDVATGSYQVHDQGEDYSQYQGHFGQSLGQEPANLQYQLVPGVEGYSGLGGAGHVQTYNNHES